MPFDFRKRVSAYLDPYELVGIALKFFFKSLKPGTPSNDRGKDPVFAAMFKSIGHHFFAYEETTAIPNLVASCYGAVLELGPGTGNQLPRFQNSALKHVYGVEPNSGFMDVLSARALETGLQDIYTPINCGIEHADILRRHGIKEESMDCVLSIQVMCSVDNPAEAAAFLYRVLKPGGELIFFEHHASHDWLTSKIQKFWDLVWPLAIGGCHMHKRTKDILMESGNWEIIELTDNEEPWLLFPRAWGKLRKVKEL